MRLKKNNGSRAKIIQRFERLPEDPRDKENKELYTFYKRMLREKQHLFTFLFIKMYPKKIMIRRELFETLK